MIFGHHRKLGYDQALVCRSFNSYQVHIEIKKTKDETKKGSDEPPVIFDVKSDDNNTAILFDFGKVKEIRKALINFKRQASGLKDKQQTGFINITLMDLGNEKGLKVVSYEVRTKTPPRGRLRRFVNKSSSDKTKTQSVGVHIQIRDPCDDATPFELCIPGGVIGHDRTNQFTSSRVSYLALLPNLIKGFVTLEHWLSPESRN